MRKVWKRLKFYFGNTTLHGFAYLSGDGTVIEKLFWTIAILCSLTCCILLFRDLIVKVLKNPVIVQQPDTPVSVKNIPFPAISLCGSSVLNDTYDIFSSLLRTNTATYPIAQRHYKEDVYNWTTPLAYMQTTVSFFGLWMERYKTHSYMVISSYGWCNSFNTISDDEMFIPGTTAEYFRVLKIPEVEMFKHMDKNLTELAPLYTFNKDLGLVAGFKMNHNDYIKCYTLGEGFLKECDSKNKKLTLVIHSPFERPDARHRSLVVRTGEKIMLSVTPQIRITDETLLGLDVDERKCYQEDEKKLKFFKAYSAENCLKECESSFILNKCGCVPYHMVVNSTDLICTTLTYNNCYKKEYKQFQKSDCKCYPPCEDTSYEIQVQRTQSQASDETFFEHNSDLIILKFKYDYVYPQIKRKYFTVIDWFSFVGGILGLFFGFSFLSIFEIAFHSWMVFVNVRKKIVENDGWMSAKRNQSKTCGEFLRQFFGISTIHGLKYISDGNMRIAERLAWIISFILSVTACIFMIIKLNQNFTINGVSITTGSESFNISQVPFPAATMLNVFSSDYKYQIDNHYVIPINTPPDEIEKIRLLGLLPSYILQNEKSYESLKKIREKTRNITNYGHEIPEKIRKYSKFNVDELPWISWAGDRAVPAAAILTSKGLVYDVNMAPAEDLFNMESISTDFHYTQTFFPIGPDTRLNDTKPPFYSVITPNEILTIVSSTNRPRPFFFHSPYEYPMEFIQKFEDICYINIRQTTKVSIVPEMIVTAEDVKKLPLSQRMCYLENERKLKFFKIYTQKNCKVECLSLNLLKKCQCVPFDIIRENGTKICELYDYICVDEVKTGMIFEDDNCVCLQPCDMISYSYEFVEFEHEWSRIDFGSDRNYADKLLADKVQLGIIKVDFKEREFAILQRVQLFTILDYLSYVGGLLGLFAGISVLSIFEIFYFFTLRLFCEILRHRKNRVDDFVNY